MKIKLNDNEEKLFEEHPSFLVAIFYFILLIISIGLINYLLLSKSNTETNCFISIAIACFSLIFLVKCLVSCFESIFTKYIITNKRIVIQSFNLLEINFDKIESIATSSNLFFELFRIGTILAKGTGGTVLNIKNVPDYLRFRENLLKTKEEFNKNNSTNSKNSSINNSIVDQQPKSKIDELKELKVLLDSGTLTQEEFDIEKKKILSKN